MESREILKYVILPYEVKQPMQIIRIDQKLPQHLTVCKGIFTTVKGLLAVPNDIQQLGEISLLFNSGQLHPYHYSVSYFSQPLRKINPFLPVKESFISNYHISGFYADNGFSTDQNGRFVPYTIHIYLKCKAKV